MHTTGHVAVCNFLYQSIYIALKDAVWKWFTLWWDW